MESCWRTPVCPSNSSGKPLENYYRMTGEQLENGWKANGILVGFMAPVILKMCVHYCTMQSSHPALLHVELPTCVYHVQGLVPRSGRVEWAMYYCGYIITANLDESTPPKIKTNSLHRLKMDNRILRILPFAFS